MLEKNETSIENNEEIKDQAAKTVQLDNPTEEQIALQNKTEAANKPKKSEWTEVSGRTLEELKFTAKVTYEKLAGNTKDKGNKRN